MSKIKVPQAMLQASVDACFPGMNVPVGNRKIEIALEAALRWWSENPIRLTIPQASKVLHDGRWRVMSTDAQQFSGAVQEAQRIMFLAPEDEPKELSFEDKMNLLTVEVNRLGISVATEILRRTS